MRYTKTYENFERNSKTLLYSFNVWHLWKKKEKNYCYFFLNIFESLFSTTDFGHLNYSNFESYWQRFFCSDIRDNVVSLRVLQRHRMRREEAIAAKSFRNGAPMTADNNIVNTARSNTYIKYYTLQHDLYCATVKYGSADFKKKIPIKTYTVKPCLCFLDSVTWQ